MCRKKSDGWKIFRIYKGKHTCNGWRGEIICSKIEEWWKFDSDCLYVPDIESDTNKLTGLGSNNQKNSIRIGWRYIDNKIQLLSYVHNNDTEITIMDSVDPNQSFYVRVEYKNDGSAELQVNDKIQKISIKKPFIIFRQYPYFGGQATAPHDMTLYMK